MKPRGPARQPHCPNGGAQPRRQPLSNPLDTTQAPHQRREPPRPPCQRPRLPLRATTVAPRRSDCATVELPALVSTSSSSTLYQIHLRPGLLPGHSTIDHRPPAGRILPTSRRRRWGEELPYFSVMGQKVKWVRLLCQARPSASMDPRHCYSGLFHLPFELFKFISKLSLNFKNL
jgi:hypothetical protein